MKKKSSKKTVLNCNYCGQSLQPGLRFCSRCGKKVDDLVTTLEKDQHLYNKFRIENLPELRFDTNKSLLIFDIKNSLILDEDNIIIGSVEIIDKLTKYKINVYSTEKLEFKIYPKILSLFQTFKIKSNKNSLIAKIRKKLFSLEFYNLEVISPRGEKWFTIKSSKNFKSNIKSNITNKTVSEFGPIKSFNNIIFSLGVKDPKYLFIQRIFDKNTDIRILISAFLVYYINVYSKYF
jgi:hypothetical protein